MNDDYSVVMDTPLPGGTRLGIRGGPAGIACIDFLPAGTPVRPPKDAWGRSAEAALEAYFRSPGHPPDVALALRGTPFQCRVWAAMRAIPPGQTRSYGALAAELGSGPRAVAGACRANPVPILVPCHRVVAVHGLGGFMGTAGGSPLELKKWLLRHEGAL